MAAKRLREEEATQVVTDAKRHAAADAWHPENHWQHQLNLRGPPPGWDALPPACRSQLALPPGATPPEPLRPANHAAAAVASQQEQQEQQEQQREQREQLGALGALGGAVNIDWRSPEAVAHLLRMLHLERLHRLGQQLPAGYHRTQ